MKIYTRTGDAGETGLIGGERSPKDSLRIALLGDIDELNAAIGMARSMTTDPGLDVELQEIQCRLFDLGAESASPAKDRGARIESADVDRLEQSIDEMTEALRPLRAFILPGGCPAATALHLARTVCRRAERSMISLHRSEPLGPIPLAFLNRLSDWLFVAARTSNHRSCVSDVEWHAKENR